MTKRRASLALMLGLYAGTAGAAGAPSRAPMQLLPLPGIAPPSAQVPVAPPINPGVAPSPPNGLSPLLAQPGPAFELPQRVSPAYPPLQLPGPIDQQKTSGYRAWLQGQQRVLQRSGVSPDDVLSREIQQQLLQLEQAGGSR